eukprot:scaffold10825_cov153-Amphora_coffeaeformis.AAC.3
MKQMISFTQWYRLRRYIVTKAKEVISSTFWSRLETTMDDNLLDGYLSAFNTMTPTSTARQHPPTVE